MSEPNWKVEALNGRVKIIELEARIEKSEKEVLDCISDNQRLGPSRSYTHTCLQGILRILRGADTDV